VGILPTAIPVMQFGVVTVTKRTRWRLHEVGDEVADFIVEMGGYKHLRAKHLQHRIDTWQSNP